MKVLVTGAAGFIGSHLVDALLACGDEVVGVDSLDPGVHRRLPRYLAAGASYVFSDLRAFAPDERCADVEAVVHLAALGGVARAAREPAAVMGANAAGTARLVELCARWPRLRTVVLGSSFSVYGAAYPYRCPGCGLEHRGLRAERELAAGRYDVFCPRCGRASDVQPLTEDAAPDPLEPYAASKLMQELCFRGFTAAPVAVLRFSSVYGPRLRLDDPEGTILARLAAWVSDGVAPRLLEDGRQLRDWVAVADVVQAVRAVLAAPPEPRLLNVCTGAPVTLLDACGLLAQACGRPTQPQVVGGVRPGDIRHCLGSPRRLQALLGRPPRALAEAVATVFEEA